MFSHDRLPYHAFSGLSSALLTIFRFFSPDTTPDKGKTLKRTFDASPRQDHARRGNLVSDRPNPFPRTQSQTPVKQHPAHCRNNLASVACRLICHDFLFCQIKFRKKMKKSSCLPRFCPRKRPELGIRRDLPATIAAFHWSVFRG